MTISFIEDFGAGGREDYFDRYGIIRDVMQNHLAQVLALLLLDVRQVDVKHAKAKVLDEISPIEDCVVGQYEGYEVKFSITPTYAATLMFIKNERWDRVPILMRCGKKLNTNLPNIHTKFEIRLQFKPPMSPPEEVIVLAPPDESEYETLISKVIEGDQSLFVSFPEIEAEWKIFTPILQQLREEYIVPKRYFPDEEPDITKLENRL